MINLIPSTTGWKSFYDTTLTLTKFEKGHLFEILTYQVLKNHYRYASILKNVWLLRDNNIPHEVKKHLNLTNSDEGIDIIAETNNGEYWAIQCKFKTSNEPPTVRELSTFTNLSYNYCKNISNAILFHTGERGVRKKHLLGDKYLEIGLDFWLDIQDIEWDYIVHHGLAQDIIIPSKRSPRPHQNDAIQASIQYYLNDKNTRGKLIMPCGTGKSLAAYWIADALNSKSTIVAVPSLALIKQSLDDWTKEMVLGKRDALPDWLCICSDESTGKVNDDFVSDTYSLGIPTTTSENEIAKFLALKSPFGKIIFTTYQSADKLASVSKRTNFKFDLAILDEAHKTVGAKEKSFSVLLKDDHINISKRMFMTATERVVKGAEDNVLSMDDETVYGKRFYQLTFKKAINEKIITDYKIITVIVNDSELQELINKNRFLSDKKIDLEAEAQMLTTAIALKKAIHQFDLRHTVSFHRSINASIEFKDLYSKIDSGFNSPTVFQISSKLNAGQRSELLNDFKYCPNAIITNARCLTEGVDVPAIDCVLFADQKNSIVDIVQASGRALRQYTDKLTGYKKELGYIIIPIVLKEGESFEDLAESNRFKTVIRIVSSLSTQDETIAEELKLVEGNEKKEIGGKLEIIGTVNKTLDLDLSAFTNKIITKIWERVSKVNWRPFKEGVEFTKTLGLKNVNDWRSYCTSGNKPFDIPSKPYNSYPNEWKGWNNWLGTENKSNLDISKNFFSIKEAKIFMKTHTNGKITSQSKFQEWVKNGIEGIISKPVQMPSAPGQTYKNDPLWRGLGDFLGTNRVASRSIIYLSYDEAKKRLKKEKLNSKEEYFNWLSVNSKILKKEGIILPKYCNQTYETFWEGWNIFLSNNNPHGKKNVKWMDFKKAREFVRSLGLNNSEEWYKYCKGEIEYLPKPPYNIPVFPYRYYKKDGYTTIMDWLGTREIRIDKKAVSMKVAKEFVRTLNLKKTSDWKLYITGNLKNLPPLPDGYPQYPDKWYNKDPEWKGMGDFLGITNKFNIKYLSFVNAREVVHQLKLQNQKQWRNYCKSGNKLTAIPSNPDKVFAKDGWISYPDWLGTN